MFNIRNIRDKDLLVFYARRTFGLLSEFKFKELAEKIARKLHTPNPSATRQDHQIASTGQASADLARGIVDRNALLAFESFLLTEERIVFSKDVVPEVSIVVVMYNRVELSLACLQSLAATLKGSYEVILYDNGSTDRTQQLLSRIDGATILHTPDNLHFLRAFNRAAKSAGGPYMAWLNNDTTVLPGLVSLTVETLKSSDDIGAVGARVINLDGRLQEAGSIIWRDGACIGYLRGGDPLCPEAMFRRDVDFCSAYLLMRRALFEKLGGLDEDYAPAYYEDVDLCLRMKSAGYRIVYEPAAVLFHHEYGSAFGDVSKVNGLMIANHAKFLAKNNTILQKQPDRDDEAYLLKARDTKKYNKRILFLEDGVPYFHMGAGFPRSNAILKALVGMDHFVTFYPTLYFSEGWESAYREVPREVEIYLGKGHTQLREFLESRRGFYDRIIVSRPHNMEFLKQIYKTSDDLFSGCEIIYDAEAIFAKRELCKSILTGDADGAKYFATKISKEVDLASIASKIVTVSEGEKKSFVDAGYKNVNVVSGAYEVSPTPRSFADRRDFLFVGSIAGLETPNADSLLWFLKEVFPLIQHEIQDVRFLIVGKLVVKEIEMLRSDSVKILGMHDDLTVFYDQARVFVAPTRYSAGIPLKVLEASSRGVPTVATSLLIDQLGWTESVDLVGAPHGEPELFARKCIELYQNENLWERCRDSALAKISSGFSNEALISKLDQILA